MLPCASAQVGRNIGGILGVSMSLAIVPTKTLPLVTL
jgi:hypothetical protein